MPIYEYYCSDCREVFEKLVRVDAASTQTCPRCQGSRVSKMLSTFAAVSSSGAPTTVSAGGCACGGGGCGCR